MNRRTIYSMAVLEAFVPMSVLAQGPVGPVFQASEPTTTQAIHPGIAAAPGGSFVGVWQFRTPTDFDHPELSENREIHGRRFGPGGLPLGDEFVVNTVETGQQEQARVAMNADGDFAVAWQSRVADGAYQVYARRYRADGTPRGQQFRVSQGADVNQRSPRIAMNAAGRIMVAWTRNDLFPRSNDAFARCYGADGTPLQDDFRVHVQTEGTQGGPSVAAMADGGFLVAYIDWSLTGDYDIRAQRFDAGCRRVGAAMLIAHNASPGTFFKNSPAVAAAADGDFVVAWNSEYQDGDGQGVYARRYRADGTARGDEFRARRSRSMPTATSWSRGRRRSCRTARKRCRRAGSRASPRRTCA